MGPACLRGPSFDRMLHRAKKHKSAGRAEMLSTVAQKEAGGGGGGGGEGVGEPGRGPRRRGGTEIRRCIM